MSAPRIFISHSAKDAPELLWKVHDAFEAAGYRVLMDKARLKPGTDWRNEIYTWLHRAHGAVVLLTEEALRSEWVRHELSVLAQRRCQEPDFHLVPILVPPLTDALLREKRFEPLDLSRLQAAVGDRPEAIAGVVETFAPLLQAKSETRIDLLARTVSGQLPSDEVALERAARVLDASIDEREEVSIDRAFVARSLFHAEAEKIRDAVAEVAAGMSYDQVRKVIDITVPFWVDPQAIVEVVREAAQPAGPHRILLLTAGWTHIGNLYARRAELQYPVKWAVVPVTDSGGDDFVGAMVSEIRAWFRSIDVLLADADDGEVDSMIANTTKSDPIIVVLPPGTTIGQAATLRTRYPGCILIMLTRNIPDEAVMQANEAVVLEPRLGDARETVIKNQFVSCRRLERGMVR